MSEPLHILVVDDDRAHGTFVGELIRLADGWSDANVDTAISYRAALAAMQRHSYDIALFDYLLDTQDGIALLREIRRAGIETPVVMLTGHGAEEVAVEAMKSGAADYLGKASLTSESIVRAMRHAMTLSANERERRQAELALRASEERFRALVENSSDVLILIDNAGRIAYTTPSADRHFGWARDEMLGQTAVDFLHPDDLAMIRTRIAAAGRRPGEPVYAELRVRHADGTYRTIEGVGVDRLHEPSVGSIVVNARDVTDRRLLEDQLRQVQKMEAVGQLAGGIAHDFNNLLTAILGYCNLLLEDLPAESDMRPDLDEIRKAGDRAAALTRQLLAFSRRQMLQPQPIEISSLIGQMDKMLRRVVGEDIELVMALEPELPVIKADPASLEQILVNLAVNARDAMPDGGRLTVETTLVDLDSAYVAVHPGVIPGRYVMLAVSDSGVGMDAATLARAFEPFFTTKEQGKGTGLGLATVYGLVKQNGGYIWVYSEPAHGTVFKIYLPPIDVSTVGRADPMQGHTRSGSETVLVVEDEEAVRALGSEVLRRHGYAVLEARDAGEALSLVERHQEMIDLMVTDVVMPHITGPDLAARIRQARPSLKVLYMSGYTDHAVVYRELAAGAPFLQKPFTPQTFARKVRAVLDGAAAFGVS